MRDIWHHGLSYSRREHINLYNYFPLIVIAGENVRRGIRSELLILPSHTEECTNRRIEKLITNAMKVGLLRKI